MTTKLIRLIVATGIWLALAARVTSAFAQEALLLSPYERIHLLCRDGVFENRNGSHIADLHGQTSHEDDLTLT